jgi:hypothetical protein
MFVVMKQLLTEEKGAKKIGKCCANEANQKSTTKPVPVQPDLTFDQLKLRCNSETAVLRRILNFPILH